MGAEASRVAARTQPGRADGGHAGRAAAMATRRKASYPSPVTFSENAAGARPQDAAVPWWKSAVFYQIYPRSFLDTDGDGVGDLEGIRRRLPHLAWLGIDAL